MINITYTEPMEEIRAAIETALQPVKAFVGVLPPGDGISLVMTGGAVQHDLAGNVAVRMQFAVNAKAKGQETATAMLGSALSAIHRLTFEGDGWACTGVSTNGGPVQVGSDPQGYVLMGGTATARLIFWNGEAQENNEPDND